MGSGQVHKLSNLSSSPEIGLIRAASGDGDGAMKWSRHCTRLGPGTGEWQPLLPLDGEIALRVEGAKASMVRGMGKGLSWTQAHPGERMGRTRHPGAVSRAGQMERKAQSQSLNCGSSRLWLQARGWTWEAQPRGQNDTWEKMDVVAAQGRQEAGRPLNLWGQERQEEAGELNGKPGRVQ